MAGSSLRDKLTKAGFTPSDIFSQDGSTALSAGLVNAEGPQRLRGKDVKAVAWRLDRLLRKYASEDAVDELELNAMVDAAASVELRLQAEVIIAPIQKFLDRWECVAKQGEQGDTCIARIYVFSRHVGVQPVFLSVMADRYARYVDGQIPVDRWTQMAEKMASRSVVVRERLRQAREPYKRAAAAREWVMRELADERDRDERRRQSQRDAAFGAIENQIARLKDDAPCVVFTSPSPSTQDVKLCICWANISPSEASCMRDVDDLIKWNKFEANRLISARMAERSAISYYSSLGYQVEDVSIHQLTRISDRWKSHDLEASDFFLDVKNARRSYSSRSSYSELCVSQFKSVRWKSSSVDVRLVGALSNYVPVSRLSSYPTPEVTILGETSRRTIDIVAQWISSSTDGRLVLLDTEKPRFLPGWFFEYPEAHYHKRQAMLNELPRLVRAAEAVSVATDEISVALRVLVELQGAESNGKRDSLTVRLAQMYYEIGFTRLTAVAWAMVELVKAAGGDVRFRPDLLYSALFPVGRRGPMLNFPLARFDPEGYVAGMADAIKKVWFLARDHVSSFQRFQLLGTGILRGENSQKRWITILAYCGGQRLTSPRARCGKTPLVIGVHESCPECLRLVCPDCSYCGAECRTCGTRQQARLNAENNW